MTSPQPPSTNRAILFVKPHAMTPATIRLVEVHMKQAGLRIIRHGRVTGREIADGNIIDKHYSMLSQFALYTEAADIVLDSTALERFKEAFGVEWESVVQAGDYLNAAEASGMRATSSRAGEKSHLSVQESKGSFKFPMTPRELGERWDKVKRVKVVTGMYVAKIGDKYVCNGFYPRNREKFTAPTAAVQWYDVEWAEATLTWAKFRGDFLGPTDPNRAATHSLRGTIVREWKALGLTEEPSVSDNGVHASAGPIEGMVERYVWLKQPRESDPFVKQCAAHGVSPAVMEAAFANAVVSVNGRHGCAFDVFEDVQTSTVISQLRRVEIRQTKTKDGYEPALEVKVARSSL